MRVKVTQAGQFHGIAYDNSTKIDIGDELNSIEIKQNDDGSFQIRSIMGRGLSVSPETTSSLSLLVKPARKVV